jgi:hypothetical protein
LRLAFFALAELRQAEGEDRLEQIAIGVTDQAGKTGLVEMGRAAIDLDADFVFVPLAAAEFDKSAIGQHQRADAADFAAGPEVIRGSGGKVEEPATQKLEQGGFACFIRAVDDLQSGIGQRDVAIGEVAEVVDVQMPDLHDRSSTR